MNNNLKILNLYAGIGGNRKLWGDHHEITAVELDESRADTYKKKFVNDEVIVSDAHDYLLHNYERFDFIWASPPCQSHSRTNHFLNAQGVVRYPDMKLYQEILFLESFHKGFYCVENVVSYYEPLIKPQKLGRHYLWCNFTIPYIKQPKIDIGRMNGTGKQRASKKSVEERNEVNAELGLHVLNQVLFNKFGIFAQLQKP